MKKIILISIVAALSAIGCKNQEQTKTDDEALKLQKSEYQVERNLVDTIILKREVFHRELLSNGKLSARQKSNLRFGSQGKIVELNVINGQKVAQGDVIARLEDKDLKLQLNSASTALKKADIDMKDYLIGQGYSLDDMDQIPSSVIETAQVRSGYASAKGDIQRIEHELSQRVLVAPFSGVIANLEQTINEMTTDKFCTIINDEYFEVKFPVLESEISMIAVGDEVNIIPFYENNVSYRAKLVGINPVVDDNGLMQATAQLKNSGQLYEGMNVKVMVEKPIPNKLVVPKSAVVIRDNLEVLFVYNPDGKVVWTYVHIEMTNSTHHVVEPNKERSANLKEGDAVIFKGNLNLADGSEVEIFRETKK